MRIFTVAVLGAALSSCGPTKRGGPDFPAAGDEPARPALPAVPVELRAEHVAAMDGHDESARSPILDALAAENARWIDALSRRKDAPAYFVAYQVVERRTISIGAEGGSLLNDDDDYQRGLDVEVRVGSPEFDNRAPMRDDPLAFLSGISRIARIPFGEDPVALRQHVALETDRVYRASAQQLRRVATATNITSDGSARSPDFVHMPTERYFQPKASLTVDKDAWVARVRDCSTRAARGVATRSTCQVDFTLNTVYYVNSEGTELQMSWTDARFTVSVGVKADDGMSLSRTEMAYARTPEGLPGDAKVDEMIGRVNADLSALHSAPVVDPYSGPAILQGRAAAVFFHEVFGHRIEGHRQKDESSGKTFSSKLGERIMPEWLSVYDDPTIATLNGEYLNGFYHFDDEGVRAQRVSLVEHGVLRGFEMARNPIPGFPRSNGHGRHSPGLRPVSRQGNLVVEASRSVPEPELKALLIAEIRRQGKPFGMMFTDISGGFTNTQVFLPQSFKVNPIMAYRVYPDGREELVRGVDIEGTPLNALGSITAASRVVEVFNGMCGAESGWVPVSAAAPSLLLSQLEVARSESAGGGSSPTLPPP